MILFYDKVTGAIEGTIEGRIHTPQQLKMWMGERETTERMVVNWKPTPGSTGYEPDAPEMLAKVIVLFDKNPSLVFNYKVNTKTGSLVLK